MSVDEGGAFSEVVRAARAFEEGLVRFYSSFAKASQEIGGALLVLTRILDIVPTVLTTFVTYTPESSSSPSEAQAILGSTEVAAKKIVGKVVDKVPTSHVAPGGTLVDVYDEIAKKVVEVVPGDVLRGKDDRAAMAIVRGTTKLVGFLEDKVVNGFVNGVAKLIGRMSKYLHLHHKGEVGWYQAIIVIGAAAVAAFLSLLLILYGGA